MRTLISIEMKKFIKLKTLILILVLFSLFGLMCYQENAEIKKAMNYNLREITRKIQDQKNKIETLQAYALEMKEAGEQEENEMTQIKIATEQKQLQEQEETLAALKEPRKRLELRLKQLQQEEKGGTKEADFILHPWSINNSTLDQKSMLEKEKEVLKEYQKAGIVLENKFTAIEVVRFFSEKMAPLFMPLLIILLIGDTVAGEQSEGTLRAYLNQPITKGKVYLSKYLAAIIFSLIVMLGVQLVFFLFFGMKNGWGNFNLPMVQGARYSMKQGLIAYVKGSQSFISVGAFMAQYFALQGLLVITTVSMGMLITVLFDSGTLALTISSGVLLFFYYGFVALTTSTWIQPYIFICYGHSWNVLNGDLQQVNLNFTMMNNVETFIVTTILCFITGFLIFRKKEIYT